MTLVPVAIVGVFGALIGSFLNVVVYRVPRKLSVVSPPSACPNCGMQIKAYDNVPVISWLFLRGRCRGCSTRISVRYPLVELGTAALFVLVAVVFAPAVIAATTAPDLIAALLVLVAYLYLAAVSIALALIDLDTHTLPNRIILPSYIVPAVLLSAAAVVTGDWTRLGTAGFGLLILGGLYLVLHLVSPRGMGGGDVKLAGVLGIYLGWMGWGALIVGGLSAFLLGGLFGIILLLAKRAGRTSGIPFGPWMLLGAWIGILAGSALWAAYLSLFGLAVAS
ncbi:peptidase A24 [Leifsonia sp. Leaf325]|nr:A24 family peptidase [Leifsonia sp. Leaf325]KQQ94001.1 peptidase A24 [Leifsonia sp. Leaf325]